MHNSAPVVATLGNFDGLHLGHQRIIARVVEKARACNGIATVITFYPLPHKVLKPEQPFFQLMSFAEKAAQLKDLGIQKIIKLRFNHTFMQMSPQVFITYLLSLLPDLQHLVLGEDFRFGYQRQGNISLLQGSFTCEAISVNGADKIGSTMIRKALSEGNLRDANTWLGKPYSITGKVMHGRKQGRLLGIPTANIAVNANRKMFKGTYIAEVLWQGKTFPAVSNCGTRPTVDGKRTILESHLLDFSRNLYGERITVSFLEKIRDEKRFDNIESLQKQIQQDIAQARAYFETIKTPTTLANPV